MDRDCPERKNRASEPYGGVIIYIKDSLSYVRRHEYEPDALECVWVHVKLYNNRNVLYIYGKMGPFKIPPPHLNKNSKFKSENYISYLN